MNKAARLSLYLLAAGFGVLYLSGCQTTRAKIGKLFASAPADNGTPAKVESGSTVSTLPIPAASTVEAIPATGNEPARTVITLSAPTELRTETRTEKAQTGTIDTAVAQKRIEVEQASKDRAPLLYVAIACGVLGILALGLLKEWPVIGRSLLLAAALSGVAWKVAEIPWWAFLAVIVGAGVLILGYKRSEWDRNGDGTPDIFQK